MVLGSSVNSMRRTRLYGARFSRQCRRIARAVSAGVRKIDTVAVLRCLGASGAQVLTIYLIQAAAMGLVGAGAGAALGVAIQFGLARALGDFLPVDVVVSVEPQAILLGLAIGVWVAVAFALRPLLVLRRVSPLQAIRRDDEALSASRRRDSLTHITNFALVASVLGLTIDRAETVMRPGDVLIQRGTRHAWANRSDEIARIAFILVDGSE